MNETEPKSQQENKEEIKTKELAEVIKEDAEKIAKEIGIKL